MTKPATQLSNKTVGTTEFEYIQRDILIADMVEQYPQVIGYLVEEYGFHCVSCFISGFEVLEDGARVHGIVGDEFTDMLVQINKLAAGEVELR